MNKLKKIKINSVSYVTFGEDTCIGFKNIEDFEVVIKTINDLINTVNLLSEALNNQKQNK